MNLKSSKEEKDCNIRTLTRAIVEMEIINARNRT